MDVIFAAARGAKIEQKFKASLNTDDWPVNRCLETKETFKERSVNKVNQAEAKMTRAETALPGPHTYQK